MSSFNLNEPSPKPPRSAGSRFVVWDVFSILILLGTIFIGIYFVTIFLNPLSPWNPLQPVPPNLPPTLTITPLQLDATWTPTATVYVSPTATLKPSITPQATSTLPNFVPPTNTAPPTIAPSLTATPKAPFTAVSINSIESVVIPHLQDLGCNWTGVGGTVDDQNGGPIIGIVVRLTGFWDGKKVELTTVSGISPEYGKAGFEFVLGTEPISTNEAIFVQLLDQAGLPLSEQVNIKTSKDCKNNLVLVRFKKNR